MELRNGVHKYKTYFQAEGDYIHIPPAVNTIFSRITCRFSRITDYPASTFRCNQNSSNASCHSLLP